MGKSTCLHIQTREWNIKTAVKVFYSHIQKYTDTTYLRWRYRLTSLSPIHYYCHNVDNIYIYIYIYIYTQRYITCIVLYFYACNIYICLPFLLQPSLQAHNKRNYTRYNPSYRKRFTLSSNLTNTRIANLFRNSLYFLTILHN